MKMYTETCMFFVLLCFTHKSTKHACFHVFSPFSTPHYIIMVKGLLYGIAHWISQRTKGSHIQLQTNRPPGSLNLNSFLARCVGAAATRESKKEPASSDSSLGPAPWVICLKLARCCARMLA